MFTRLVAIPIILILGASLPPAAASSGKAKGSINVPANANAGKMSGALYDVSGSIAYEVVATLTPTPQLTRFTSDLAGTVKGFLYKSNSTASLPTYSVMGTYKAILLPTNTPFPVYAGQLEATLISNSPVAPPFNTTGRLSVTFIDTTISTGSFNGAWKLP